MMNQVIKVLMERDDMTRSEAEERVAEVRELLEDAVNAGSYIQAENILADELGLEIDYIFDLI